MFCMLGVIVNLLLWIQKNADQYQQLNRQLRFFAYRSLTLQTLLYLCIIGCYQFL